MAAGRDIHASVCRNGYGDSRGTFVRSYGSEDLDASLLLLPLVGFLPATDPRVRATTDAIVRELSTDGFVHRYLGEKVGDGLPPGEGYFLPCSFWLTDNLALQGRYEEATSLFERLLAFQNDVGLYAEEFDPVSRRMLGNFPQAFTHVMLINTAHNLSRASSKPPHHHRAEPCIGPALQGKPSIHPPAVLAIDVGGHACQDARDRSGRTTPDRLRSSNATPRNGGASALVVQGVVEPLELAHLPYREGRTFEDCLGASGLERLGYEQWRAAVFDVVARLYSALQVDYVVLGGGNAARLRTLPVHARRGSNDRAFAGGFRLWSTAETP